MKRSRRTAAATTKGALLDLIRPRLEAVAVELTSLLWERLETQLDACLDAARAALESDPTPLVEIEAVRAPADEPEADEEPSARSGRKCSNCRQPGHRANRCPNAREADEDDEEDDDGASTTPTAPAPDLSRRDRFAAIEQAAQRRRGEVHP